MNHNLYKAIGITVYCMAKAKTSLTFDKDLWIKFKIKCVQQEKKYTDVLEGLMKKWVK